MLGIYTFVFGSILQIKWPDQGGGNLEFAAILFSGMLIHLIEATGLEALLVTQGDEGMTLFSIVAVFLLIDFDALH